MAVAFTGALVASSPTVSAAPAAPAKPSAERRVPFDATATTRDAGRYIVVLKGSPAASYDGTTSRFAATRATGRTPFRADSRATRAYTAHLRTVQVRLADKVGVTAKDHYTVALNGFSAQLSADQAAKLAGDKSVLMLAEDTLRKKDTWNTPTFLGLDGPGGAWTAHGGNRKSAGEGIVVGDIDSGFFVSKSFSGTKLSTTPNGPWDITMDADGNTRMEKLDGSLFRGKCETGQAFALGNCSSKIIGARFYPDAYLDQTEPADRPESEYISPRDGSGHGSHTASTAAGIVTGPVSVEGRTFGTVSGMAPGAKLAIYKVCFENVDPDLSGCATSASIAAIDDAVADGVDVINYSISGALDTVLDPVELAFEGAAEAGVFVSASAGNSGPDAATVAHNSPWLTTVAAGTHVNFEGTIVLADGTTLGDKILGASINGTPVPRSPIVTAEASVVTGGDAADARICGPDTLDPAKTTDKIVVCYRGKYDRVAKSAEVKRAGGKAMILVNPTPNSLDADFHAVPTIHISDVDGAKLMTFLSTATAPTALFSPGNKTSEPSPPLPQVAGFSSRGPALANEGDLLKPDITAPGQSVLAAVAPPSNQGRAYDLYSGTSMSAPHITGLAAFLLSKNPSWTPMDIKSAMMTSASRMKNATNGNSADVFATGAGQVDPKKFFDPGLFVTETGRGWRGFITSQGLDTGVPAIEANELNIPSFADGGVAGETTLTRTFRASRAGTWKFSYYLPGFTVTPSVPSVVSKRANDLIEVTFTFARTTAPVDQYAKGTITLAGPTRVRMPVAMRPVLLGVPAAVSGTGATGSVDVTVDAGFTGSVDLTSTGLAAGDVYSTSLPVGEYDFECYPVLPGTTTAVFQVDAADDTSDVDLTVYAADSCDVAPTSIAGTSATGAADEEVVIEAPDAGAYYAEAFTFEAGDQGEPIDLDIIGYNVGADDQGDLTVAPDPLPVVQGQEATYTASWTGLATGRYIGIIGYEGVADTTRLNVRVSAP